MPTQLDAKGRTVLSLDTSLDVTQAAALAGAFLDLRGKDIIVDASQVRHLGAQCGQILLSAKRFWVDAGRALRLSAPSPEFMESLRLLGLISLLPVEEIVP